MGLKIGDMFGRFRVLEWLGEGAMGVVYRAELQGPGGFSKIVALKTFRRDPLEEEEPGFADRFMSEARLGALLKHHNVVEIYDFGEHDGYFFISMEYVDGISFARVVETYRRQNRRASVDIALQLMKEVCHGLDYAHRARDREGYPLRLIHRDIKPSNLLLGWNGEVKICDFGVARAASNLAQTESSGVLIGTTRYMSSEQAWGRRDLDHRSDLFSVGAVLFELITARPLYVGEQLELVRRAQDADVESRLALIPPAATRSALIALLRQLLSRSRDERLPSAADVALAIEHLLNGTSRATGRAAWADALRRGMILEETVPSSPPTGAIESINSAGRILLEGTVPSAVPVPLRGPQPQEDPGTNVARPLPQAPKHRSFSGVFHSAAPWWRARRRLVAGAAGIILFALVGGTRLTSAWFSESVASRRPPEMGAPPLTPAAALALDVAPRGEDTHAKRDVFELREAPAEGLDRAIEAPTRDRSKDAPSRARPVTGSSTTRGARSEQRRGALKSAPGPTLNSAPAPADARSGLRTTPLQGAAPAFAADALPTLPENADAATPLEAPAESVVPAVPPGSSPVSRPSVSEAPSPDRRSGAESEGASHTRFEPPVPCNSESASRATLNLSSDGPAKIFVDREPVWGPTHPGCHLLPGEHTLTFVDEQHHLRVERAVTLEARQKLNCRAYLTAGKIDCN